MKGEFLSFCIYSISTIRSRMNKRFIVGIAILFCFTAGLSAQNSIVQSLETPVDGQGLVTVQQDSRLTEWLRKGSIPLPRWSPTDHRTTSEPVAGNPLTSVPGGRTDARTDTTSVRKPLSPSDITTRSGYRVQVYSGPATRDAKNQAAAAAAKARTYFPEVAAYSFFVSPRWVCVIGDFLTHEEAVTMKQRISNSRAFNESTVVRSQVIVAQ